MSGGRTEAEEERKVVRFDLSGSSLRSSPPSNLTSLSHFSEVSGDFSEVSRWKEERGDARRRVFFSRFVHSLVTLEALEVDGRATIDSWGMIR